MRHRDRYAGVAVALAAGIDVDMTAVGSASMTSSPGRPRQFERPRSPFIRADDYDTTGKRQRVSTGTENRNEAERLLKPLR